MAIDPGREDLIRLRDVPAYLEKHFNHQRTHRSTVHRWAMKGLKAAGTEQRVKLETLKIGGDPYTSEQALVRFFNRDSDYGDNLGGGAVAPILPQQPRTPSGRDLDIEAADQRAKEIVQGRQKAIRREPSQREQSTPHGHEAGIAIDRVLRDLQRSMMPIESLDYAFRNIELRLYYEYPEHAALIRYKFKLFKKRMKCMRAPRLRFEGREIKPFGTDPDVWDGNEASRDSDAIILRQCFELFFGPNRKVSDTVQRMPDSMKHKLIEILNLRESKKRA